MIFTCQSKTTCNPDHQDKMLREIFQFKELKMSAGLKEAQKMVVSGDLL